MNRLHRPLGAILLAAGLASTTAPARASVILNIFQNGGVVAVTQTGSLDLAGATFDHQEAYTTGIVPGGDGWYVGLGLSPGMDWYRLTGTTLPFGGSTAFFASDITGGDAFSIWGNDGGPPLVGLPRGYTSFRRMSGSMVLPGETLAGMSLIPGTYLFDLPADRITLNIFVVPEPPGWLLMLAGGLCTAFLGHRRARRDGATRMAAGPASSVR